MSNKKTLVFVVCMAVIGLVLPIQAVVIFEHNGNINPASEGWNIGGDGQGSITWGPIVDSGTPAWYVNDSSTEAHSTRNYLMVPTAAQISDSFTLGWSLKTYLRVIDTDGADESVCVLYQVKRGSGYLSYTMIFGSQTAGFRTANSAVLVGTGGGYHWYETIYDPIADSADFFVDGVERISNFTGFVDTAGSSRVQWGGASSYTMGRGNYSVVEFAICPLSAPTNLVANAVSSTESTLAWDDNNNCEEGFKIERKTANGSFDEIGQVTQNITNYTDNTIVAGIDYIYRVRAYSGNEFSSYSNEAICNVAFVDPIAIISQPAAPTNVNLSETVTFDGSKSHDPDNGTNAGDGITNYRWEFQKPDGTTETKSGSQVNYSWDTPGDYNVKLTVTDDDGQTAESSITVKVFCYIVTFNVPSTAFMDDTYYIEFSIQSTYPDIRQTDFTISESMLSQLRPWVQERDKSWEIEKRKWNTGWSLVGNVSDIRNGKTLTDIFHGPNDPTIYRLTGTKKWNWIPDFDYKEWVVHVIYSLYTDHLLGKVIAGPSFDSGFLLAKMLEAQHLIKYEYSLSGADIGAKSGDTVVKVPTKKYVLLYSSTLSSIIASVATEVGFKLGITNQAALTAFVVEGAFLVATPILYNIASDPPDFNYTEIALPEIPYISGLSQVNEPDLLYICDVALRYAATNRAMLISLERYEGAKIDCNDYYANLQYYVYHSYAEKCQELSALLANDIEHLPLNSTKPTLESIQLCRQYLYQNGLPEIEMEILTGFGFDTEDVTKITEASIFLPDDFFLSFDYTLKDYLQLITNSYSEYVQSLSEPNILNLPPVANAGSDQTVYAWIDGIAEVDLDGSGSNDFEDSELTYLWSWTVGGNTYDANSVNPTIELPVGQHTITLVVNDGTADSESNEVVITVVGPIEANLNVMPKTLNSRCNIPKIMTNLLLPKGITKDQINTSKTLLLYPGQIEADWTWFSKDFDKKCKAYRTTIFASFDKDELMDAIPDNGKVELSVIGQLKTGQYFYGSDTVTVISPGNWPRPWHRPWFDHRWDRKCRQSPERK